MSVSQIPKSTYYYIVNSFNNPVKYSTQKALIKDIFDTHKGLYGYKRVTLELWNQGVKINHKTVLKLMRELGLKSKLRCRKYRTYRGKIGKIAPNKLQREFNANKPNVKWVTDVSQFAVKGRKYYLSPILDLYNREIISYTLSERSNFDLTIDMLNIAFNKINDGTDLVMHSDQGWQYQIKPYRDMLKSKNITQSMSRKGNCLDNAVMENFFGILKNEFFYNETFKSTEEFINGIDEYIYYYNNVRIKERLGGLSPVQYRLKYAGS